MTKRKLKEESFDLKFLREALESALGMGDEIKNLKKQGNDSDISIDIESKSSNIGGRNSLSSPKTSVNFRFDRDQALEISHKTVNSK